MILGALTKEKLSDKILLDASTRCSATDNLWKPIKMSPNSSKSGISQDDKQIFFLQLLKQATTVQCKYYSLEYVFVCQKQEDGVLLLQTILKQTTSEAIKHAFYKKKQKLNFLQKRNQTCNQGLRTCFIYSTHFEVFHLSAADLVSTTPLSPLKIDFQPRNFFVLLRNSSIY